MRAGGASSARLAWSNVRQSPGRAAATAASVTFSILLIFMQLGFSQAARRAHTLLYDRLDFDLILTSDRFESLKNTRSFPAARLYQARGVEGVAGAAGLNVEWARWSDPRTEEVSSCMLVGIDVDRRFVTDGEIGAALESLRRKNTVLVDRMSDPDYGRVGPRTRARINDVRVEVAAAFSMGTDFKADGRALASNATFYGLLRRDPALLNMGMVKTAPGHGAEEVRRALEAALPPDVRVFGRREFIRQEQDYYTEVKPIGMFFKAGVVVAFCVGAVILFQVLATDISTRLAEFATLKAIGLGDGFVYRTGFFQALAYGAMGYVPALLAASLIFGLVNRATRLPIAMDVPLAGLVLFLSLCMCVLSGVLALNKVRKADPAELF